MTTPNVSPAVAEPISGDAAPPPNARAALAIAHPGHELTVHGWLEQMRPRVFVLTDGSRRSSASRLPSTTKVLQAAGATPGCIYGRHPEAAVYRAILDKNTDFFVSLAEELAQALAGEPFDYVAGDMAEGFNPVHDLWRLVVTAAVAMVNRKRERRLLNFDFALFGRQDTHAVSGHAGVRVELDDASFTRKLTTAQAYPDVAPEVVAAIYGTIGDPVLGDPDIQDKVKALMGKLGLDAFRVEYLRPVPDDVSEVASVAEPPFFEIYGEKLVAAGRYEQVLRYQEHIVPIAAALGRLS